MKNMKNKIKYIKCTSDRVLKQRSKNVVEATGRLISNIEFCDKVLKLCEENSDVYYANVLKKIVEGKLKADETTLKIFVEYNLNVEVY